RQADALAGEVGSDLGRRLEQVLTTGGGDAGELVDGVGVVYREWKSQRVERVAWDHVVAAFAEGVLAASAKGTAMSWIVDDDGPCPDCDDNALAGPLPAGEAYPTGQAHPPAHPGCRCLLAPAQA
ncbi:MAG: hypothetical protein ACRD0J_05755, partial [Acidimicrobiales bacterium]